MAILFTVPAAAATAVEAGFCFWISFFFLVMWWAWLCGGGGREGVRVENE